MLNPYVKWVTVIVMALFTGVFIAYIRYAIEKAAKAKGNTVPVIQMSSDGWEFVIEGDVERKGDHWRMEGYIHSAGDFEDVIEVIFHIPKGIPVLRLVRHDTCSFVLVDVSNPKDRNPKGYLANTDSVKSVCVSLPEEVSGVPEY